MDFVDFARDFMEKYMKENNLTYDDIFSNPAKHFSDMANKANQMAAALEKPSELNAILYEFIDSEEIVQDLYEALHRYISGLFEVDNTKIESAAKALCTFEGGTWWTDSNMPETFKGVTPDILNSHWINKARIVTESICSVY